MPFARPQADRLTSPVPPDDRAEPGYEEWLADEIAAGTAELDAGNARPAHELWRALGLE